MRLLAIRLLFLLFIAAPATAQTIPQSGWWYSPTEGGRGYAVEYRNGRVFMAALMYSGTGVPSWYLGQGPLVNASLLSDLEFYGLGTNLFYTTFSAAQRLGSTATQTTFTSSTAGTIRFLDAVTNSTAALQRFEFTSGGVAAGANAGLPESGWWWAPSEPGAGYFLEFQKDAFYFGAMHYANPSFAEDGATPGQSIWDVALGTMTSPTQLQATLVRYQNGQSLGGAYRTPTLNHTVTGITINFTSTTTGTMTVQSNGKTLALERFRF